MKYYFSISPLLVLVIHGISMLLNPKDVELDYIFPQRKKVEKVDKFKNISLFFTKDSQKYLKLFSPKMEVVDQKKGELSEAKVDIFHEKQDFFLTGKKVFIDNDELKYVDIEDGVKIESSNFYLSCLEGRYEIEEKIFKGNGNVLTKGVNSVSGDKIILKSDKVIAYPLKRKAKLSNVNSGTIERKRVYEGKVLFRADNIGVDYNDSMISLDGGVFIKRNNVSSTARKASIFLENFNKRLKYYEMTGDVLITQSLRDPETGNTIRRRAYAEKLEGSTREKKITLTGSPRVKSKNDIVRGTKIIIRENASILEVVNSTAKIDIRNK